jgi:hypothetical protein
MIAELLVGSLTLGTTAPTTGAGNFPALGRMALPLALVGWLPPFEQEIMFNEKATMIIAEAKPRMSLLVSMNKNLFIQLQRKRASSKLRFPAIIGTTPVYVIYRFFCSIPE